jgi:hypothetical protein
MNRDASKPQMDTRATAFKGYTGSWVRGYSAMTPRNLTRDLLIGFSVVGKTVMGIYQTRVYTIDFGEENEM